MIDLHIHTNASDGQYSPAELVRKAAEKGVSVLAVTDHDTVAGLSEAAASADLPMLPLPKVLRQCRGL